MKTILCSEKQKQTLQHTQVIWSADCEQMRKWIEEKKKTIIIKIIKSRERHDQLFIIKHDLVNNQVSPWSGDETENYRLVNDVPSQWWCWLECESQPHFLLRVTWLVLCCLLFSTHVDNMHAWWRTGLSFSSSSVSSSVSLNDCHNNSLVSWFIFSPTLLMICVYILCIFCVDCFLCVIFCTGSSSSLIFFFFLSFVILGFTRKSFLVFQFLCLAHISLHKDNNIRRNPRHIIMTTMMMMMVVMMTKKDSFLQFLSVSKEASQWNRHQNKVLKVEHGVQLLSLSSQLTRLLKLSFSHSLNDNWMLLKSEGHTHLSHESGNMYFAWRRRRNPSHVSLPFFHLHWLHALSCFVFLKTFK